MPPSQVARVRRQAPELTRGRGQGWGQEDPPEARTVWRPREGSEGGSWKETQWVKQVMARELMG